MSSRSESDDTARQTADTAIRFYGRRKGKPLKAGRQTLIETLVPTLRIATPGGARALDPASLFSFMPIETRLEIGFGSGEHLAAQAAANPGIGFIGSEVFLNGVASLARHVDAQKLANVRVFDNDVRHLLPSLRDNCFTRVSLLFPDPWPKTRHAKRRFVSPVMLDELARLLADGGELRIASDHPVYVQWTLLHATAHPAFQWTAAAPEDWRHRPTDSVATRYEEKARKAGRKPVFLTFFGAHAALKPAGNSAKPLVFCGKPHYMTGHLLHVGRLGKWATCPLFFYCLRPGRPDEGLLERLPALEARVEPTLEAMGFEVVRIVLTGGTGQRTLQVMADRRDGSLISVDDCADISQALSAIFDVEDPVPGHYDLEVSSAGIDRPLTRLKDFTAYAGFEAKVETKMPVSGRKRFRGRLAGATEDGNVTMRIDETDVIIAFANIGTAKLVMTDELIAAAAKRAGTDNQTR